MFLTFGEEFNSRANKSALSGVGFMNELQHSAAGDSLLAILKQLEYFFHCVLFDSPINTLPINVFIRMFLLAIFYGALV